MVEKQKAPLLVLVAELLEIWLAEHTTAGASRLPHGSCAV